MPNTPDPSPSRQLGRPQSIDPDAVARLALQLFSTHGYAEVSMAQIAEHACIGRKSLYRYFASKADLVWGGLSEASLVSNQALQAALNSHEGTLEALLSATEATINSLPDLEVTRGRLRLIAEQPELLAQAPVRTGGQNQQITQYLRNDGLQEGDAHYLAVAYGSVTLSAWIRWAQSSDPSPAPYLTRALRVLRIPT